MKELIILIIVAIVLAGLFFFCAVTHEDPTFWLPKDKADELERRLNEHQNGDVGLDEKK